MAYCIHVSYISEKKHKGKRPQNPPPPKKKTPKQRSETFSNFDEVERHLCFKPWIIPN